ncbi:hypothetical protein RIF29_08103 [Crotalaria pallida]|uniref:J domain-containing protein n=1 Tax=Crotalaria pallida TaxID=3830 RepID=A0AAN9PB71_CROPI
MDCNKEEAFRAKGIAEKRLESRDFMGARKFALKAQQLYPDVENIAQLLIVCEVHCSALQKLFNDEMDWYGILQVEQTANDTTIKKQYRKFALQLHPDKNKFVGAEAAFKLIGEAQRVLLDREKRSIHDMRRRGPSFNKAATSRPNQQKATNVRPNFKNSNPQKQQQQQQKQQQQKQQQQQSRQPAQQGVNGARPTFWTVCPFCSVRYQYYREILNKSLRCQHCTRPFVAYDVGMQGTSPAPNSSKQASGQQKGGVGSQGDLHADKSNAEPCEKKSPIDVSGKPNGKRKKRVVESSGSSDSVGSTDSEDDMVAGEDGCPGGQNHSTTRDELTRRSTRQKRDVSYKESASEYDDDFPRPSKRVKESGAPWEAAKTNDQHVLAADLKNVKENAKQKQTSEHYFPYSTAEANHINGFVYPDAEFSDFDKDRKKEQFAVGQVWAMYDTADGMPRFYALILKVLSPGFKLQIAWFEPRPDDKDEMNWANEGLPVACGKFKLDSTDITDDHMSFSHQVLFENIGRNAFKVYPRKGETWALFKNWDIKWYADVESHQQYEFEFVEILSDYVEGEGVFVAYLTKLKGFVSLFSRVVKEDVRSFQIPPAELFRFSHRIPSFKMTGREGVGVPVGSYELDPASFPMNIEEIAVHGNMNGNVGENTRSSYRSKPLPTSEGDVFTSKVNLERSNLAEEKKDSVDGIDDRHASPDSAPEAIEIPDSQFFNFDNGRSLEKFQIGQIWAFYSDEDGLPKYYGQINKIVTSPEVQLHFTWLTCCRLPENTIKWEDEDMIFSCGRFKLNKAGAYRSVYTSTSSISHLVHADLVDKNKNYDIFPRKGEVWAIYRKWSSKIKCADLGNWEYDIVEVLGGNDLFFDVLVLAIVGGFNSVFAGKSNEGSAVNLRIPRKELLRFSHQIPAFKLTEKHGKLRGFWELDPGALPVHYYSSKRKGTE